MPQIISQYNVFLAGFVYSSCSSNFKSFLCKLNEISEFNILVNQNFYKTFYVSDRVNNTAKNHQTTNH